MRKLFPILAVVAGIAASFASLGVHFAKGRMNPYMQEGVFHDLASIPVNRAGRIMPMSSAAADSLRIVGGKSTYLDADKKRASATKWIWSLNARADRLDRLELIKADNPQLAKLFGAKGRYFTFTALEKNRAALVSGLKSSDIHYARACDGVLSASMQYALSSAALGFSYADSTPRKTADEWYKAVDEASEELGKSRAEKRQPDMSKLSEAGTTLKALNEAKIYEDSCSNSLIRIVPEADGHWLTSVGALTKRSITPMEKRILLDYADIVEDIASQNESSVKTHVSDLKSALREALGQKIFFKAQFENAFNILDSFTAGMALYIAAFLLALVAAASRGQTSRTIFLSAAILFAFAFANQTFGVFARMYIQSRPPVTNLYSSVVFTGWGAALMAFIALKKGGVNFLLAGAAAGAASLLLALNLPYSGDSMGMMTAVLNSNFWLTMHVVTIMLGYCGVFLAGFLSILKIFSYAIFRRPINRENSEYFFKNLYGVLCFALLFSFAGTMLGGIWADFSWGRFWGWDPKENGALMIILWGSAAIHARTLHKISDRTFLSMCVVGNIVGAWAWFGVNMLGVGLHSYGFMSGGWTWFGAFSISQIILALAAFIPPRADLKTA